MPDVLPEGRSKELTEELLKGAIDIHVHPGPHLSSSPRSVDPFQAAEQARDAGMAGLVYMDVFEMTTGTAWLVNLKVEGITVYGGIILNTVYGGMNPRAVKTALDYGSGARYVSFGAHSTYYQANKEGKLVDGEFKKLSELYPEFKEEELSRAIRIPLEEEPGKELDEILNLIADSPKTFLNTGHVSPEEALRLVELSGEYGIDKILVASAVTKEMSIEQQREAVEGGAYIEHTLAAHTHTTPIPKTHYYTEKKYSSIDEGMDEGASGGVKTASEEISEIGAENCIICTDFGVYTLPPPVEGMREFIACLLDLGITPEEIREMTVDNPKDLLEIE